MMSQVQTTLRQPLSRETKICIYDMTATLHLAPEIFFASHIVHKYRHILRRGEVFSCDDAMARATYRHRCNSAN